MGESSLTFLSPNAYSSGTCGYCCPSGSRSVRASSKKYGMVVSQMSVDFYQGLIDRGWRRSGTYTYHPDMANTCCPQYTIRLDTKAFRPSKKHRQVMNRWNRFISTGYRPGEGEMKEGKGKGKAAEGSWLDTLSEHERRRGDTLSAQAEHRYEIELVPATATKETFGLYKRYQVAVHKDKPTEVSMKGFERFLCQSPLQAKPIKYRSPKSHLPKTYGSYHLLYRVDGDLVGISVIDILPACVSSVYFIWDPDWAWASLGKLSAMREVALALEMAEAGAEGMQWVYMGYWIPDCQKMRYKSEYSPSYLLDPGTHVFHPLSPNLDRFLSSHPKGYTPFEDIRQESDDTAVHEDRSHLAANGTPEDELMEDFDEPDDWPKPPPPGFSDPTSFTSQQIDNLICRMGAGRRGPLLARMGNVPFIDPDMAKELVRELAAAVGIEYLLSAGEVAESLANKAVVNFG